MDSFIGWSLMIIAILILIFMITYLVAQSDFKYDNNFRWLIIGKRIIITILLIYITIVNLLVSIFPLQMNFYKILQWVLTLYLLVTFVYDLIYSKKKNENLLLDYRKETFKNYDLKDLFDITESKTKYKEDTNVKGQNIGKIIIEGKIAFSIIGTEYILIPKFDYTKKELEYIYNHLNYNYSPLDMREFKTIPFSFERDTKFYAYINTDFHAYKYKDIVAKIDNWKNKYLDKIFVGSVLSFIFILGIFVVFHTLATEFGWEHIIEWIDSISKWLF